MKAEFTYRDEKKVIEQITKIREITISGISEEDAKDLVQIIAYIGGSQNGPRGAAERLYTALQSKVGHNFPATVSVHNNASLYVDRAIGGSK